MRYNTPQVWNVNKSSPTPLFRQLAENIKWSICLGNLGEGWRLPPVRELARDLKVSVDTVRSAYKSLEEMGYVVTRPYHGTEVVQPPKEKPTYFQTDELRKLITIYTESGMDLAEIRSKFEMALNDYFENEPAGKLLFIECSPLDRDILCTALAQYLGVTVDFMLLSDLNKNFSSLSAKLMQYRAVITTYFHFAFIRQLLHQFPLPVFAVVTELGKKAISEIHLLPEKSKVGIICRPEHSSQYLASFVDNIRDDLLVRMSENEYENTPSGDTTELLNWADLFLCAHPFENLVRSYRPNAPVHSFFDKLNAQSVGILREMLKDLTNPLTNGVSSK